MAYSTIQELRLAVAPLSGGTPDPPNPPSNTAADLPNATLLDAVAEADATIDSYIGSRYVTPVAVDPTTSAIPHPIDYMSRNIAVYLATLTFRGSQDFSDNDPVARRYNATMAVLISVQKGTGSLPGIPEIGTGGDGGASGSSGAAAPYNQYDGTMFNLDDFDLVQSNSGQFAHRNWWS